MLLDLERILGPQTVSVSPEHIAEQAKTIRALCDEDAMLRRWLIKVGQCLPWCGEADPMSRKCTCGWRAIRNELYASRAAEEETDGE